MLKNYHKTSNKAGFTNISGCGVLERYPTKMLSRLYRLFGGQEDESMQNDSPPTNAAPFEPLPPTNASFSAANSDSSYATPEQKIALANAITGAKVTEFNPSQRMHIVVELYANAGRIFMSEEKCMPGAFKSTEMSVSCPLFHPNNCLLFVFHKGEKQEMHLRALLITASFQWHSTPPLSSIISGPPRMHMKGSMLMVRIASIVLFRFTICAVI